MARQDTKHTAMGATRVFPFWRRTIALRVHAVVHRGSREQDSESNDFNVIPLGCTRAAARLPDKKHHESFVRLTATRVW